jgi:hypothetical protein
MRVQLLVSVALLASSPFAANLVLNPGFEERAGGAGRPWQIRKGKLADWVEREDGAGHCVRLRAATAKEMPLWVQTDLALAGGQQYMVGYSVKAAAGTKYRVYLEWWKQDGKYGRCTNTVWRVANGGWEQIRFRFTFPEKMKPPYLVLQLQGPGEVRYDDVAVQRAKPEPVKEGCLFSASFETDAPTWEFAGGCRVAKESPREGKACLQVSGRAKGDDPAAIRRGIVTQTGHRYRLTYAVRAAGGSAESTGFQFFRVFTSWGRLIKDGRDYGAIGQHDGMAWQDCFASWQTRALEFDAPQKPAGKLFLTLQVRGPGSACFDALELREIGRAVPPPPFELVLTQPRYRDTFFPGQPNDRVRGFVRATRPGMTRAVVRLGRGKQELRVSGEVGGETAFALPGAIGELTVGAFDVKGISLGKRARPLSQARTPLAGRRVIPRADGIMMVDGTTPFFPIGVWNAAGSERALADLAGAGVNLVRCGGGEETVERLASFGLMAAPSLPNAVPDDPAARAKWEEKATGMVKALSVMPNVLNYYLVDEPLWNGTPLPPLLAAYDFYRRLDPWHPLWLNAAPRGTVADLARYNQVCDISGVDIYPVPEGGSHSEMEDKTVTSVGAYTRKTLASTDHRKPVWMTLQGFAWQHLSNRKAPDAVFPTFEQSRFMAYDAVVHGAHGIMYWGTHYIAVPEHWDVLLATTRDLASVSAVLAGEPVPRDRYRIEGESLAWCVKRASDREFLIVVNESPEPTTLKGRVPWAGKELRVLTGDAGLPANHGLLKLSRGRFRDELGPYDARLYTIAEKWPKTPPLVFAAPRVEELTGRSLREQARYLGETEAYAGKANWIWFPGASVVAESTCVLRRRFELTAVPKEAWVIATADDQLVLRVNGKVVVEDDSWNQAHRLPVEALLKQGTNLITVEARDAGKAPASFLCDLRIVLPDGRELSIVSDMVWKTAEKAEPGWQDVGFDDKAWSKAEIVAPYGSGAWGKRLLLAPRL